MIKRRKVVIAVSALAVLAAGRVFAQGAKPRVRIGCLIMGSAKSHGHLFSEFLAGMKALGYVEGRDFELELRWAEGRPERAYTLVAELLSLKPTIIVTQSSAALLAFQRAKTTVPIVFATAGDTVGQGIIKSFRRPGGNITGVAFNDELIKKVYELVRAVMPSSSRMAILVNEKDPAQAHHVRDAPLMTKALGFEVITINSESPEALDAAFHQAVKWKAQAFVISAITPFTTWRSRIIELSHKHRIPTFHGTPEPVPERALASYTFPFEENYRRAAGLVDKILKGTSPAEIPVEIPTRYEIAINLKTAKALGISVPHEFLARAHKVIE